MFRLDKSAMISDVAVKPKRKLIVMIAFVLSGFVALFTVLIVNAIKKHKKLEEVA